MTRCRIGTFTTLVVVGLASVAGADDLTHRIEAAHGARRLRARAALQARVMISFGDRTVLAGTMLFDTSGGRCRIETDDGRLLVFDGDHAWVAPPGARLERARFHLLTWPYFVLAPFKLRDPGTRLGLEPGAQVDGRPVESFRLEFDAGVGDTPDDWYVGYVDPASGRLRALAYIVTYGKSPDDPPPEPHAIVYDDFVAVDGVTIARAWTFRGWSRESGPTDDVRGRGRIEDIRFLDSIPDGAFARPPDSREDPLPTPHAANGNDETRLAAIFAGTTSCFVLSEPGRTLRHGAERCAVRYSPCSTFKIPNSLIALDTGVVKDPDAVVPWDPERYPAAEMNPDLRATWARHHTLRSAIKYSVVWFYRRVAVGVGTERMAAYLKRMRYGNEDISSGIDGFWLGGSLRISADEQVRLLEDFHEGRLGFPPEVTSTVEEILTIEKTPEYTLAAKTGTGAVGGGDDGAKIGWWVGYVERAGKTSYFAFNMEGATYAEVGRQKRMDLCRRALEALDVLPKGVTPHEDRAP